MDRSRLRDRPFLDYLEIARADPKAGLKGRELDRGADAAAVGIVEELAGGAVVDDAVVGIARPRCR